MPRPAPQSRKSRPQQANSRQQRAQSQHEVVDPRWLVKAMGITLVAAAACAWLTFCFLFYQGQWQLVLHPRRTALAPQTVGGAAYELVHFGVDETAEPQLVGWWVPAPAGAHYAGVTVLFLPAGDGSLADSIPTLAALHGLGVNIFAFDYRGYGQSAAARPNEQTMTHDAESAWLYLTASRHIVASDIVLYGTGVGAPLAVKLAGEHGAVPGVVLDAPSGDLLRVAMRDPRTHLVPARLLFHERFALAAPLGSLPTPKLLLWRTGAAPEAYASAADPKMTVELRAQNDAQYGQAMTRFLDEYVGGSLGQVPSAEPSRGNPH